MLTIDELRQIPGVTVRDPAPGADFLEFDVATTSLEGDEIASLTLEVRCPLHREEPLLGGRDARVERRGGGLVPRRWSPATLEEGLRQISELARARRAPAQRRREADEAARLKRERREAADRALAEAARLYVLERTADHEGPLTPSALPEFLRRCGSVFADHLTESLLSSHAPS